MLKKQSDWISIFVGIIHYQIKDNFHQFIFKIFIFLQIVLFATNYELVDHNNINMSAKVYIYFNINWERGSYEGLVITKMGDIVSKSLGTTGFVIPSSNYRLDLLP
jgi:hypothetical protein